MSDEKKEGTPEALEPESLTEEAESPKDSSQDAAQDEAKDAAKDEAQKDSAQGEAQDEAQDEAQKDSAQGEAQEEAKGEAQGEAKEEAKGEAKEEAKGEAKEEAKGEAKKEAQEEAQEEAKDEDQEEAKGEDQDEDRKDSGTDGKKRGKGCLWIPLLALAIVLLVAILVVPTILANIWLNKDYSDDPDTFYAKISVEKARVSPFLGGFSLTGLKLYPKDSIDNPITIGRVEAKGLDRIAFGKLLVGQEDEDIMNVLEHGTITFDGLEYPEDDHLGLGHIGSLTVTGVSLPMTGDFRIQGIELRDFLWEHEIIRAVFANLSVSELTPAKVDMLHAEGFSASYGKGLIALDIKDLFVEEADFVSLTRAFYYDLRPDSLYDFILGTKNLRIDGMKIMELREEIVTLGSFVLSGEGEPFSGQQKPATKNIAVAGVSMELAWISQLYDPPDEVKPLIVAMGPSPTLDLLISVPADTGAGTFSIFVKGDGNFALDASQQIQNNIPPGASKEVTGSQLLGSDLGEGYIDYKDDGFLGRLGPWLAGNGTTSLEELLEPLFHSIDPNQSLNRQAIVRELDTLLEKPGDFRFAWQPLAEPTASTVVAGEEGPQGPVGPDGPVAPDVPDVSDVPDMPSLESEDSESQGLPAVLERLSLSLSVNGGPAQPVG
ncbi:MAG: hypothetical protein LBF40_07290, partial [Deltaproteobacteria bacterium]|nr:hypothetical protein [Deltaproteobacteria bacterium]